VWLLLAVVSGACHADRRHTEPVPLSPPTPEPGQESAIEECRVVDELKRAAPLGVEPSEPDDWAKREAARLLPASVAKQRTARAAVAIRDAMAREDFASMAHYVTSDRGLCLQASKGAACRWMPADELRR